MLAINLLPKAAISQQMVAIYVLRDPRRPYRGIRYVGQTINPVARYKRHLTDFQDTYKDRWIKKLKSLGLRPQMEVVQVVPELAADGTEIFWIAWLRQAGAKLTNTTAGGVGVRKTHCREGHSLSEHAYVSPGGSRTCHVCRKVSKKKYAQANKDRLSSYLQDYYRKHQETIKTRSTIRYKTEKDLISAKAKARYRANREATLLRVQRYQKANKEAVATKSKAYQKAHKEELAAYKRTHYEANKAHIKAYKKEYNHKRKVAVCLLTSIYLLTRQ